MTVTPAREGALETAPHRAGFSTVIGQLTAGLATNEPVTVIVFEPGARARLMRFLPALVVFDLLSIFTYADADAGLSVTTAGLPSVAAPA